MWIIANKLNEFMVLNSHRVGVSVAHHLTLKQIGLKVLVQIIFDLSLEG
jgi:hypothetical protein